MTAPTDYEKPETGVPYAQCSHEGCNAQTTWGPDLDGSNWRCHNHPFPVLTTPQERLMGGIVDALMSHAAPGGAIDYPMAAAAFTRLLAEMIAPQPVKVRRQMVVELRAALDREITLTALKASVIEGGKPA